MRRVRDFAVCFDIGRSKEVRQHNSWHQVCDVIAEALHDDRDEVIVRDTCKSGFVIARFSSKRLMESERTLRVWQSRTLWRSERFKCEGDSLIWFAHLNASDFSWVWIEGASREVPFRLNYIERSAQHSPNGLCAWGLALISEWRDRLMIRA